ncbi:pyruvate dehydrogenase complex dihydrolipoamide acetyltransferase [Rhodovulum viride]|uniref:Dihydrolipoamide acetyltransferase component of pyruvate dehydrogenase complex n=1 Tax=Rhodovulum viride TaxID=1231134 RepID=A0ABX9DHF2_9RHOB|nr:dihydrolipoamide acetyltransferase family protein [Rhodovulum viride]RAP41119.1 pyruvate dehydrogenase complex dihydrolipoamide acetyltransferase [Rhodovulum viride]
MATELTLPALSAGMEDAVIAAWLVAPGDRVEKGQPLAEVETDKATMELEAEAEGRVGRLAVKAGARADVGQVIAVLLAEGESLPEDSAPEPAPAAPAPEPAPAALAPGMTPAADPDRPRASPLARRLATQAGLTLDGLSGSGPKGRIVRVDIERLIDSAPPQTTAETMAVSAPETAPIPPGLGPYEARPVSQMRRTIARRLVEAKQTIPHFYLEAEADLEALLTLRTQVNDGREGAARISVNDFIVKAAARALARLPEANVIWRGDEIWQLSTIDIAVAVATDGGLMTPILRGADRMSLGTLSAEMKDLAARARAGTLRPEDYQGGGFSVSNLGMYGVRSFSAIVNPPQSCILAAGAAERRPIGRGDQIVLAPVMSLTLSVDHRSVDGALGAQLLAEIRKGLEDPMSLLL